jgi:S-adenosylmethionine synthetase
MAHKVMPPPFTSEQLEVIEGMIEKAISDHDDTLDWSDDIEDAVQSAASDVQHSVDMLSNTVDDIERRLSDAEANIPEDPA